MKNFIFLMFLAGALSCQPSDKVPEVKSFRIPGEFEPQDAIWLGYKTVESYGDDQSDSITLEMIRMIHPYIELKLIIENDTLVDNPLAELHKKGIDTSKIELIFQENTDVWYRDPGPVFCVTPENELGIIDFKYTGYKNIHPDSIDEKARKQEALDRDIAKRLGIQWFESSIATEGGALETNGKGTLIQVEAVTLRRNPHLTKKEIEEEFARCCGIVNVIWLPVGVADDPHTIDRIAGNIFGIGTGGHTDEFVRFANDSTILLSWVEEDEREENAVNELNYNILKEAYQILSKAVDAEGRKFTIIKMPHPDPHQVPFVVDSEWFEDEWWKAQAEQAGLEEGDTAFWSYSSSYLNHLTTNDILLVPEYGDPLEKTYRKDSIAKSIFRSLYPDRKIVGINPLAFNKNGGGMHCRFQTQPKIIK